MALKRWIFSERDDKKVEMLREKLDISRLTAVALVSLGITCMDSAEDFLLSRYPIGDACLIKDMEKGAQRVREAIDGSEKIAVFGDYDVDGIMSTALICQYLESVGADVVWMLPKRNCTGYGLVKASVDDIIKLGAGLIITVDNGVSSHDAIDYANENGIETIICDHHKVPATLPNAVAVIDPHREDDSSSFKSLAGVGVTLKFVSAIEGCEVEEMLEHYGHFTAIGTIADVMPLVGENRVIVSRGLSQLAYEKNLGLSVLMQEAGLDCDNISSHDIAFTLAPRLNAAGRMGNADTALDILMTDDYQTAVSLAKQLTELNHQRQKIEQEITGLLIKKIMNDDELLQKPIIVVSDSNLNSGVSGVVCSRLVERFGKPVIIIALDEVEARGSGRSIEGLSLYDVISSCDDIVSSFGGHDMAAGFTIAPEMVGRFKNRVEEYCEGLPEPIPYKQVRVGSEISFTDIGESQISQLMRLAPFGPENEEPVFATLDVKVTELFPLGDKHSRLAFEKEGKKMKAALFSETPNKLPFSAGDRVDIAYVLSLYTDLQNRIHVSMKIKCMAPAGFSKENFETLKIYDRMCCRQQLKQDEKALITPCREDIALIYRSIKRSPIIGYDTEQISYRFYDMPPGKALTAVKVLKELGLLIDNRTKEHLLEAVKNPSKKELEQSETYAALHSELH